MAAKSKYDNERELEGAAGTKETNAYAWVTPPGARLANECGVMCYGDRERAECGRVIDNAADEGGPKEINTQGDQKYDNENGENR